MAENKDAKKADTDGTPTQDIEGLYRELEEKYKKLSKQADQITQSYMQLHQNLNDIITLTEIQARLLKQLVRK